MNSIRSLKGHSFEIFVTSVLRQIASSQKQEIFFEAKIPTDLLITKTGIGYVFDAIAPNGFDDISGPVVFELKSSPQSITHDKLQTILNGLYKRVMQLTSSEVTIILITNSNISLAIDIEKVISAKIPYKSPVEFKIWGPDVLVVSSKYKYFP